MQVNYLGHWLLAHHCWTTAAAQVAMQGRPQEPACAAGIADVCWHPRQSCGRETCIQHRSCTSHTMLTSWYDWCMNGAENKSSAAALALLTPLPLPEKAPASYHKTQSSTGRTMIQKCTTSLSWQPATHPAEVTTGVWWGSPGCALPC